METSKFEIADYLDSKEMIAHFNTTIEEGDNEDVIVAMGHISKAIGMAPIAKKQD